MRHHLEARERGEPIKFLPSRILYSCPSTVEIVKGRISREINGLEVFLKGKYSSALSAKLSKVNYRSLSIKVCAFFFSRP